MLTSSSASKEIDLSGLLESVVDSSDLSDDAESDSESDSELSDTVSTRSCRSIRDCVRECLEKDPSERNDHDIGILLEFTQHLTAFNDLTLNVRRALCGAMVFAVVEKAGTVVLSDGEELDSWSVLVNGGVEVVEEGGKVTILSAGDSFGLPPTLDKQYFSGLMRTRVDDCQFVCVTQEDYFRILKQGLENQKIILDTSNKPILVYESRSTNHGYIIIRGTKNALIEELFKQENGSVDPTFVEDFLLTQRIFLNLHELAEKIIDKFGDFGIRDRVTRVMLLWVNNHFIDFEVDLVLMEKLQRFQSLLEQSKETMSGQLRLLQIACSAKSRPRTVVISRASRDHALPFNIMGGADNNCQGVFISSVNEENKIRTGDELLSVNNVNFKMITLSKALELLRASTHLVLVLKCNFLGYHDCINKKPPLQPTIINPLGKEEKPESVQRNKPRNTKENRLKKALMKINLLHKKPICENVEESREYPKIDFPENVLKIYKQDQSYKYFLVNKETSAREVVMLGLTEMFDGGCQSRDFALFQVSVTPVNSTLTLKQCRLPDTLDSLAERLQLGSRYYIKNLHSSDQLIPDESLPDLHKESEVTLLNLNPTELALQLTLEDYACFRQIEMTEFIDDLFKIDSKYGTPNLNQFGELVNRETFWVVSEVVREGSVGRRVSVIKRFIKVALQCRECRNYNSMFAIVSGLGHCSVSRLKQTWDKMSGKYQRIFKDLTDLMDPSRNMGKYRSLLNTTRKTPMIPFYPVVKKDLTFIHLGNSSYMDNMINFEKMRMVSKEIRSLVQMSAAPFDTSALACVAAMNQLPASGSTRTLTTTTGKKMVSQSIKKSNQSVPNSKKMFEEMNMIRKVKAYLSRLVIIQDEGLLHELSLKCEPSCAKPSASASAAGKATLKRHPSPTLSTASSHSAGSKFGGASPGSYQKLMALSEPSLNKVVARGVAGGVGGVKPALSSPLKSTTSIPNQENKILLSTESSSVLPATK